VPKIEQSKLRKEDKIVLRDPKNNEVQSVIFPNGMQVGLDMQAFNYGIRFPNLSAAPGKTTNALYAIDGNVYFNGVLVGPRLAAGSLIDNGDGTWTINVTAIVGALGGDLAGTLPNPTLAADRVRIAGDTMTGPLLLESGPAEPLLWAHGVDTTELIRSDMGVDLYSIPAPGSITAALAGVGAGNVNVGAHYYYVTFYDVNGNETELSDNGGSFGALVTTTAGNGQVDITLPISTDARVVGRRIYRPNTGSYITNCFLLVDIPDNVTATYRDNISDASRPGSTHLYYRPNTTSRFLLVGGSQVLQAGTRSMVLGMGAAPNQYAGTVTGGENVIVGPSAGYAVTSAIKNLYFGYRAGYSQTDAIFNTMIGHSAGNGNISGGSCVIIGYNAGLGPATSTTVVGALAGSRTTGGNHGVCIGYQAGTALLWAGYANTLIGTAAGSDISSAPYNIVIGNRCTVPAPAGAGKCLNIGNVIFGTGLYGSTSVTSSTPTSDGKVGIGLTTPTARLQLPSGSIAATTAPLKLTSGSLMTTPEAGAIEYDGTNLYFTDDTGTRRQLAVV